MLKAAIGKGDLNVELRCERTNEFDLNKKHTDISRIFFGMLVQATVSLTM